MKYLWFVNFKYVFKKKIIKLRKNSSFNWFTPFHVLIRPDVIWKNLSRPLYHVHFTVIHTNSRHNIHCHCHCHCFCYNICMFVIHTKLQPCNFVKINIIHCQCHCHCFCYDICMFVIHAKLQPCNFVTINIIHCHCHCHWFCYNVCMFVIHAKLQPCNFVTINIIHWHCHCQCFCYNSGDIGRFCSTSIANWPLREVVVNLKGSDNDLMSWGNWPLPEPMLTHFYDP